jgi:hypothetical protein
LFASLSSWGEIAQLCDNQFMFEIKVEMSGDHRVIDLSDLIERTEFETLSKEAFSWAMENCPSMVYVKPILEFWRMWYVFKLSDVDAVRFKLRWL